MQENDKTANKSLYAAERFLVGPEEELDGSQTRKESEDDEHI